MTISNPHGRNARLSATSLVLGLVLAVSNPHPVAAQEATPQENCAVLADLAEVIMESRQIGVPLGEALALAGGNELIEAVVMSAWERPRFSVPENQQREAEEFRDNWHLACLQSL